MTNSVSNDNNDNSISINELQKKLSSSESTIYTEQGMKSIFDAYNTKKNSDKNSIEILDSNELQELVNDIKSYDGKIDASKKDGYIDIDEANLFIKDFNEKHKNTQIKTEDLFGFITNFLKRQNVNDKKSQYVHRKVKTVGKPLSQKSVSIVANINGEPKDIIIDIELYATQDKKYILMYNYGASTGAEHKQNLAKEYGYEGKDAWNEFMTNSLHFDSDTYEISFLPTPLTNKAKKYNTPKMTGGSPTSLSRIGRRIDKPLTDKEISKIDERYSNPEVINSMTQFCDFIKSSIAQAEQDLNNDAKTYGWAEHVADFLGEFREVNTMSNMRQILADAKLYLYMMMNADNSPKGIKAGKDFFAVYKNFTGKKNFDEKEIQNFLKTNQKYNYQEPVIQTYKFIKSNLNNSVNEYAKYYANNQNENFKDDKYNQSKVREAFDNMYDMFYSLTGMSKDNFISMLKDLEVQGKDPIEFLRNFSKNIINASEQNVKETLGIDDIEKLKDYEKDLQENYDTSRKTALGDDGDLVNRIAKYNSSQLFVGSLISGVAQMALYAALMTICPEFAFAKGIQSASSTVRGSVGALETIFYGYGKSVPYTITSVLKDTPSASTVFSLLSNEGLKSGSSYAISSLVIDGANKVTDEVDENNLESLKSMTQTAAIEFLAGYLFDGFLKAKIFKQGEKTVLENEDIAKKYADVISKSDVGERALNNSGIRFSNDFIKSFALGRTTAGVIGGTKDSSKEFFKESCNGKYSISGLGLAFIAGALSNATMIKFKNSSFSKEEHRILGKLIEKGPKKGSKNEINSYLETLDKDEQMYVQDYLSKIHTEIMQYINTHSNEDGAKEAIQFCKENPDALDEMILEYNAIKDLTN